LRIIGLGGNCGTATHGPSVVLRSVEPLTISLHAASAKSLPSAHPGLPACPA
jgi:hypothetical protein